MQTLLKPLLRQSNFRRNNSILRVFARYTLLMSPPHVFIDWLRMRGLLASDVACHACGASTQLSKRKRTLDRATWRCPERHETSIRVNSFFAGSHMHLQDICNFVIEYAAGSSLATCARISAMSYGSSSVEWSKAIRQVYVEYYNRELRGEMLSGIVEVDESLFGCKVKYNRGPRLDSASG